MLAAVINGDSYATMLAAYQASPYNCTPKVPFVLNSDGGSLLKNLFGKPNYGGPTWLMHPDGEFEAMSYSTVATMSSVIDPALTDDCPGASTATQFAITVTANNGSVTRSPNKATYDSASVVSLTAVPNSGFTFTGWSGAVSGTSNPINVTMNSAKSVTANFTAAAIDSFTLTVNNGTGSGRYPSGKVVAITAKDSAGYTFSSWSGNINVLASSTSKSTNATMASMNAAVTATYTKDGVVTIDTINPSPNLITFCDWEAYVDDMGSAVDTGTELISSGTATAQLTIVASDSVADTWAYGSLSAYLPVADTNNLRQVDYIKVTYSSNAAFNLSLPQAPLDNEGTSYYSNLANTSGATITVLLKVSDFIQPTWVSASTPIDLANVKGIAFEIAPPYAGGTGTIAVSEVILYQYQGGIITPVTPQGYSPKASGLSMSYINSKLQISLASSKSVTVELFSPNGRKLVSLKNQALKAGTNTLALPSSIGTGLFVVRISGQGVSHHQRMMIR